MTKKIVQKTKSNKKQTDKKTKNNKQTKKKTKNIQKKQKVNKQNDSVDQKIKLPRGRKLCHNCQALLYIHQARCPSCKSVHQMKKSKDQILKFLQKNQPKALKGILQSPQFNQVNLIIPKIQYKSSQYTLQVFSMQQFGIQMIPQQQKTLYKVFHSKNPKVCVEKFENGFLYAQIIPGSKQEIPKSNKFHEKITIGAFQLQYCHKIGTMYTAKSFISYYSNDKKKVIFKISLQDDIIGMKAFNNKLIYLTGKGQLKAFTIPIQQLKNKQSVLIKQKYQVQSFVHSSYLTCFTILKSSFKKDDLSFNVVAGTLSGQIIVFNLIEPNKFNVKRIFRQAHYQHLTCISECPISNQNQIIFATGSYDGCVKVWSINSIQPLYIFQVSNKKIINLIWDIGSKFLYVIRDQNGQNCIMICFYSIFKNQSSVNLLNQGQVRTARIPNSSYMSNSDYCSTILPIIDTIQGKVIIQSCYDLRKNSMKKKKHSQQKKLQKMYIQIRLSTKPVLQKQSIEIKLLQLKSKSKSKSRGGSSINNINSLNKLKSKQQEQKNNEPISQLFKGFPVISDFKHYCQLQNGQTINYIYGTTYNGFIFQLKLNSSDIQNI